MRKRFKIPLGVILVFLLAIAVTLLIVTKTNFVERRVNEFLELALEQKYGVKVSLGDIGGSILSGFYVTDIEVRFGGDTESDRIATVKYLDVRYDISDILHRRWMFESVLVDSLNLSIKRNPDGTLRLPDFGQDDDGSESALDFVVKRLLIVHSSISIADSRRPLEIDNLDILCGVSKAGSRLQLDLDTMSLVLPRESIKFKQLCGTVTMVDSLLALEDIRVVTDSSALSLDAEVRLGDRTEVSAIIDSSVVSLSEISRVSGVGIFGRVTIWGGADYSNDTLDAGLTVSGTFLEWLLDDVALEASYSRKRIACSSLRGGMFGGHISGNGHLDISDKPVTYDFAGQVRGFDLSSVTETGFDTDFTGDVVMQGRGLKRENMVIDLDARLGWSRLKSYVADSITGKCRVTQDSIIFAYPFDMFYKSTTVSIGGRLEYAGTIDIEGQADLRAIDEFRGDIFLADIGGVGTADFNITGPTADPNVTGSFSSDSVHIYDFYSKDFFTLIDIRRFFSEPDGGAEVFSGPMEYAGLPGQSLHASLEIEPGLVEIGPAMIEVFPFDVELNGRLELGEEAMTLTLSDIIAEIDSETIVNQEEIIVVFDDSGVTIEDSRLASRDEMVRIDGRYSYDGGINYDLSYQSIQIGTWLPYFYDQRDLAGRLSGGGRIAGELSAPRFGFELIVDDAAFRGEPVGSLTGGISYVDSVLMLDDFRLQGEQNLSTLQGFLPIDLAMESRESRILDDRPVNITLTISGTNFNFVEELFDDVEWMTGNFELDVTASGTPGNPELSGAVNISHGQCKLYYVEDPLDNIEFEGTLERRELVISRLVGKLSRDKDTGDFEVAGSIDLTEPSHPAFDLSVSGNDLPVKYDLGDIEMMLDELNLTVTGSDPPMVSGDVEVARFVYREPFYDDVETDALEAADTTDAIDYNIRITIPQNLWIKNEDADVELRGELVILDEGMNENFLGTLETMRGKFYMTNFNRTFTIRQGGTIVFDNVEEFDPRLDVELTTTVRDSTGISDICLRLTRTLSDPNIDVCEGSELTIDEALLFMNPVRSGFTDTAPEDTLKAVGESSWEDRLTFGAAGIAASQASRYFSRKLGVETFEISPSRSGHRLNPLESELTIGFYTSSRLYIYGTSQLTFGKTEEVGFDYRLSKHVFISGQRDRENLYRLNLNLSWEFE